MWSGPRNISTAMMRAWENRSDTVVWDEPLYGPYLHATGLDHPGAEEVMRVQGTDWHPIVARMTGPIPDGKLIFYQKHMTHHLLPSMDRDWLSRLSNCFLIRDPAEVLASYRKRRPNVTLEDLGFPQQLEIFDYVTAQTGRVPPVLDARDVLEDPGGMLGALCERLGVPFTSRMLSWRAGARPSDGVWGRYWYEAVERSTGFEAYRPRRVVTPTELADLVDAARVIYESLHAHRLTAH